MHVIVLLCMKNFLYKNNDIIIVLLILVLAGCIIYNRITLIMDYPENASPDTKAQTTQEAQPDSSQDTEQEADDTESTK